MAKKAKLPTSFVPLGVRFGRFGVGVYGDPNTYVNYGFDDLLDFDIPGSKRLSVLSAKGTYKNGPEIAIAFAYGNDGGVLVTNRAWTLTLKVNMDARIIFDNNEQAVADGVNRLICSMCFFRLPVELESLGVEIDGQPGKWNYVFPSMYPGYREYRKSGVCVWHGCVGAEDRI